MRIKTAFVILILVVFTLSCAHHPDKNAKPPKPTIFLRVPLCTGKKENKSHLKPLILLYSDDKMPEDSILMGVGFADLYSSPFIHFVTIDINGSKTTLFPEDTMQLVESGKVNKDKFLNTLGIAGSVVVVDKQMVKMMADAEEGKITLSIEGGLTARGDLSCSDEFKAALNAVLTKKP